MLHATANLLPVAVHWPLLFAVQPAIVVVPIFLVALLALFWWKPGPPFRFMLWLFVRLFYRLEVYGRENIPETGPALLVSNHVSYIDWVLLGIAQKRFIRFVIFAAWTKKLFIRHILRRGKVIPIDATSGPKAILKSLRTAGEALNENDLVCIFAEGRFTRTGFLLPFHRGFEQIVKNSTAPIIPVCLDELWGSIFSFYGDRTLWKWPRMVPYPVTVAFGKPLPPTATAAEVRAAVQQLAADCAIARANRAFPAHREFVRTAARRPLRPCVIDASDVNSGTQSGSAKVYRYSTVLARAWCLAQQLKTILKAPSGAPSESESNIGLTPNLIGIWLPNGIDAVVAHLATAFCVQTVVPLNPQAPVEKLQSIFAQCRFQQILSTAETIRRWPLPSAATSAIDVIDIAELHQKTSSLRRIFTQTCTILLPGFVIDRWILRLDRHQLNDPAAVLFTRGRTGQPKGVILSHRNLATAATSLAKSYELVPQDRLLCTLSPSQSTTFTFGLWTPLTIGMPIVMEKNLPLPRGEGRGEGAALKSDNELVQEPTANQASIASAKLQSLPQHLHTHRPTILLATPTLLAEFLNHAEREHLQSLRTVICTCAALNPQLATEFETRFGHKPLGAYELAELGSIVTTNVPDKTLERFTQIGNKPGTVGQPLIGISCRVANPDTLEPMPLGQPGTLIFSGANIMQGYLHPHESSQNPLPLGEGRSPQATRRGEVRVQAIRDGWYITDDQATLDEEGFITIM